MSYTHTPYLVKKTASARVMARHFSKWYEMRFFSPPPAVAEVPEMLRTLCRVQSLNYTEV